MKKKTAASIIASVIAVIVGFPSIVMYLHNREQSFSGFYFDTAVTCRVASDNKDSAEAFKSELVQTEGILSAYNEKADVYKINHGRAFDAENDCEIADLLDGYALFEENFGSGITPFCGRLTFLWNVSSENPSVPSADEIADALEKVYDSSSYNGEIPDGALIDFGAGAKGYLCDRIYSLIDNFKVHELVFSMGSSSLVWSDNGKEYTTAVINPVSEGEYIRFSSGSAFVSTSGGYERYFEDNGIKYSHIMNTDTGYPVDTDIASATVILPCGDGNGLVSDLLSTLVYIGGTARLSEYSEICGSLYPNYGMVIITEGGEIIICGSVNIVE